MATLVTGAAGFVALNVVQHLLAAGHDVVGLDRIALPERARRAFAALPGRFTLIGGSILSAADLRRALTIAPVEAVIHCAVITAGAVSSSLDLGLHLVGKYWSAAERARIAQAMSYSST